LTEDEILVETSIVYVHAERRLTRCTRCPDGGGACADDATTITVGEKPTWVDRRLRMEPCPKWAEFMVRRRLEKSGVPEFFFDSSFLKFTTDADEEELGKLFSFVDVIEKRVPAWLIVSGNQGSGKTRVAVCLLRSLVKRVPRALLWYSDVTTIRNLMKQRYDDPESTGDPFENARIANVLVVDNVDPQKHVKEPWVHDRVEALLRERWLACRSTLILTHQTKEELVSAYPTITSFAETEVCNLS